MSDKTMDRMKVGGVTYLLRDSKAREDINTVNTTLQQSIANVANAAHAQFGLSEYATLVYNYSTKELSFPAGVIYRNGKGTAKSAQTVSCASAISGDKCALWAASDGTIYAQDWDEVSENVTDRYLGYIASRNVCINGVGLDRVKVVDGSGKQIFGTVFSPGFVGFSGLAGDIVFVYSTKTLTIPSGFVCYRGKGIAKSEATVLELANLMTTECAVIYVNKNGTIYGANWNGCNAESQEDQILGYVFGRHVVIFGADPSKVVVVENNEKVYCFGDSIVAGVGSANLFHMYWHSWNKGMTLYNYGIGSTGYTIEANGTVMVGGGVVGVGSNASQSGNNTVLKVMQSVTDTMPYIAIFAGTNDYGGNVALDTFRTAVQNTLNYALTKSNHVFVITPIKRTNWDTNTNSIGLHLKDYCDVIAEECEARGIAYDNGYDVAINPQNSSNKSAYIPDGLHPNSAGHARMARHFYARFLEAIGK